MSKSFRHGVRWDTEAANYQVVEQAGSAITVSNLDFHSHDWQEWLGRVSSFAFQSEEGHHFTARKEARARGDAYWIAYRKAGGKLTHKYLGRTVDVTLARMELVAASLAGQELLTPVYEPMYGHRENSLQEPLADELLATKFFIPSSPHVLVPRPRLSTLLDEGYQRSLTVVSAPAGFGKTTLLSSWVQTLPKEAAQVAWVSLDEQDNDPVRFWMYVFTALDRLQPGTCSEYVSYLQTQQAPSIQYVLTALINRLTERQERWLLVLDDFHLLVEPAIHAFLTYLMEHLPPQLRIILASRNDPPLPLARLRARGQLLEVRAEDLRTTDAEAAAFMREVMGVDVSDQELVAVQQRTENWLVGLQLVGLSLQASSAPTRELLSEVNGNQDFILDYLTDEILNQQSLSTQTFLLHTSILERLSAPLCDAVLEQQGSQQLLELLVRSNLFIIPLDSRRHWYRYHALFAQALRYRLEQAEHEKLQALHLRASQWYAQQDQTNEAVQHALQAQAWEFAADLIEPVTQKFLWIKHELPMLWHWLEQLPQQVVRRRPRLCLAYASILHLAARIKETEPWLREAEAAIAASRESSTTWQPQGSHTSPLRPLPRHFKITDHHLVVETQHELDRLLGEILARRALIAVYYGESKKASTLCEQALTHLSEQDLYERAIVANALGWVSINEDHGVEAADRLLETSALMQAAGNSGAAINYMSVAAYYMTFQGHFNQAWQLLEHAIEFTAQPGVPPSALVDLPKAYQAELLRERNQLDSALELALQGIQLAGQVGYTLYLDVIYMVLMRIHLSRGELTAAKEALQQVLQLALLQDNPFYYAWIISVDQVRLWLASGELEQAINWTHALDQREPLLSPFARERQEVARVRVLLAQERALEALERLEPLLINAQTAERWYHAVQMLILQTLGYQMCQEGAKAIRSLTQAVRLAESEGYIRSFVDEGAPMAVLLATLRESEQKQGPTPYIDRLLTAFALEDRVVQAKQPLLPDRISSREREVLQLLAQGCSNQEIADVLVVTVETVKRHVSSLLTKLEVDNRTQAAMRARSLGLLSDES